jgi:hypothetical protein
MLLFRDGSRRALSIFCQMPDVPGVARDRLLSRRWLAARSNFLEREFSVGIDIGTCSLPRRAVSTRADYSAAISLRVASKVSDYSQHTAAPAAADTLQSSNRSPTAYSDKKSIRDPIESAAHARSRSISPRVVARPLYLRIPSPLAA